MQTCSGFSVRYKDNMKPVRRISGPASVLAVCLLLEEDCHECRNKGEDGIELRKGGVDHGVGLYIVSL